MHRMGYETMSEPQGSETPHPITCQSFVSHQLDYALYLILQSPPLPKRVVKISIFLMPQSKQRHSAEASQPSRWRTNGEEVIKEWQRWNGWHLELVEKKDIDGKLQVCKVQNKESLLVFGRAVSSISLYWLTSATAALLAGRCYLSCPGPEIMSITKTKE